MDHWITGGSLKFRKDRMLLLKQGKQGYIMCVCASLKVEVLPTTNTPGSYPVDHGVEMQIYGSRQN